MQIDDTRRKRAYYRASHRGTKEMDWFLGRFAEAELAAMDDDQLGTFDRLIALPDPLLQSMINGTAEPGREFASLISRIRRHHGLAT